MTSSNIRMPLLASMLAVLVPGLHSTEMISAPIRYRSGRGIVAAQPPNYAARGLDKPLADLPADFQEQLKTIGYE